MGYMHIDNLYKVQNVLEFKFIYALEKIHGTSAHIKWKDGKLTFFSGGEKYANFILLFNHEALTAKFTELGRNEVTIYGEAYGGRQQGQAWRYGKQLKFIAFDVMMDDCWLQVEAADRFVTGFGLEFVHYKKIPATLEAIDAERDAPSEQAKRNGVVEVCPREGVVLRPPFEVIHSGGGLMNGSGRIMAKHKRDEERETGKTRRVVDPAELEVLTKADEIADEWVTMTRLEHVLDKLPGADGDITKTGDVIRAMLEDVAREAAGEIVPSDESRRAISKKASQLFKQRIQDKLKAAVEAKMELS